MSDYFGAMGTALYNKLKGGTALIGALGGTAIYQDQAPDGSELPYVVFSFFAGGPEYLTPRDMRDDLYYVRAYSESSAEAGRLDGYIDDLLQKSELTVSGWTNFWCVRERANALVENPPNGKPIYARGGFYRIRLSK